MRKNLLLFCFSLLTCFLKAQLPNIGTTTIIPQNPMPGDFIKIVTHVWTPNQGILVDIGHTVTGNVIKIRTCYWQGMLTAIQNHIDTFMVGLLPAGNYQIDHKAYMSTTQQWCNKTDSNSVVTSFSVAVPVATAIHENSTVEMCDVYPNPTTGKIFIRMKSPVREVFIFSSLGALVYKEKYPDNNEIDIKDLPEGVYIIKFSSGGKNRYEKFVKSSVE